MGDLVLSLLPISTWKALIEEWIYSERDRDIVKRRLLDGIKYSDLAVEFDMSERQVKRIVAEGINILLDHI